MPVLRHRTLALGLLGLLLPTPAFAQNTATLRGTVVDEQGQPVPDVKLEIEYKGESRQKIVKTAVTDKKGAYIRVGLPSGNWKLTFTKEGFTPRGMETYLSGGGLSELPPVTLQAAAPKPAAGAAGAAPDLPGAAGAGKEVEATYAKAMAALKAGSDAEAEALLKQVVEAAPGAAAAHYNLGYLYMKRKDNADAEAEFRKVIELRPQDASAYLILAPLLGEANRAEEALTILQQAAPSFPENGKFQFALGVAAMNVGNEAVAEPAFTKTVELDPSLVEARFYLGSLAVGHNKVPEAIAQLERYLAEAPEGAPNKPAARKLVDALKARK
jgi:Tfp pilus assembly protein PilF